MLKGTVASIVHPTYKYNVEEWDKWRLTYEGGSAFIERYLYKFSARENQPSFERRKKVTYNPAFAKEAVDEIKNSIFQRLIDISRKGGTESYNRAVDGMDGGVDLQGKSMNSFIGIDVLTELLTMSKVGVFVDMPELTGETLAETDGKRPYLYMYQVEDIRSWSYLPGTDCEFSNILLRDYRYKYDEDTGLPMGQECGYRRMWLDQGQVRVQFYDKQGEQTDYNGVPGAGTEIVLNIPKIPFVVMSIGCSLLTEIANYQIALLNMASADISFALTSNFPFYVEQFEPRAVNEFERRPSQGEGGEGFDGAEGKQKTIIIGAGQGRGYPKGMERPGFIHPSSEPMKASMDKQEQMKSEIRQLVNLSVASLSPGKASAESKSMDRQGLESGLSAIGMALEVGERRIGEIWSMYEKAEAPTIYYPETYTIQSESERRDEANGLKELLPVVPSQEYKKAVCKKIAALTIGRDVTYEDMEKINREIDNAKAMTADPEIVSKHVELGILDKELASEISGYPKGTVAKADKEHAARIAEIAKSQTENNGLVNGAARGAKDLSGNDGGAAKEKQQVKDPAVKEKKTINKTG